MPIFKQYRPNILKNVPGDQISAISVEKWRRYWEIHLECKDSLGLRMPVSIQASSASYSARFNPTFYPRRLEISVPNPEGKIFTNLACGFSAVDMSVKWKKQWTQIVTVWWLWRNIHRARKSVDDFTRCLNIFLSLAWKMKRQTSTSFFPC